MYANMDATMDNRSEPVEPSRRLPALEKLLGKRRAESSRFYKPPTVRAYP